MGILNNSHTFMARKRIQAYKVKVSFEIEKKKREPAPIEHLMVTWFITKQEKH